MHTFEDFWTRYPKRAGGNSRKDAEQAWKARLRQNVLPEDLVAAAERYARWCDSTGITGSPYVMQARRFIGPGDSWREDWTPVKAQPKPNPREPVFPKPVVADIAPDVAARVDEQYATLARTSRRLPEGS